MRTLNTCVALAPPSHIYALLTDTFNEIVLISQDSRIYRFKNNREGFQPADRS